MKTVVATRYVTPLREGGSLPAIIEADDDGMYVLKFGGAGQGPRALVAELLAGELARAAGLPVPAIVLVDLNPELARTEPDPETAWMADEASGGVPRDPLVYTKCFFAVLHTWGRICCIIGICTAWCPAADSPPMARAGSPAVAVSSARAGALALFPPSLPRAV